MMKVSLTVNPVSILARAAVAVTDTELTGPATARKSTELGDIPAGVFLALGSGPIGRVPAQGVADSAPPSDAYDRVFAQGSPTALFSEALVRLPILIQGQNSGTAQNAAPLATVHHGLASLIQGFVSKLDRFSWADVVELFYRFGDWPRKQSVPVKTDNGSAGEESSQDDPGMVEPTSPDRSEGPTAEAGAAQALVFAAGIAVFRPRRRRPEPTGPASPDRRGLRA
jgi:hypothetical protein